MIFSFQIHSLVLLKKTHVYFRGNWLHKFINFQFMKLSQFLKWITNSKFLFTENLTIHFVSIDLGRESYLTQSSHPHVEHYKNIGTEPQVRNTHTRKETRRGLQKGTFRSSRAPLVEGTSTKQCGCCSLPDRTASSALPLRNHLKNFRLQYCRNPYKNLCI